MVHVSKPINYTRLEGTGVKKVSVLNDGVSLDTLKEKNVRSTHGGNSKRIGSRIHSGKQKKY